ncbi:enoyl-CoA hydratase/isomerase family protein [Nocardia cerradoensis]|uniref:2,3-dehydroadipyl-CoA hydratase n=1 Tax=Nocardia cerradoensis TaxID=85688 RepID=A0A231GUY8_9NOCA|nr:enoyl-CoA hydratase/isomerase family protein [Nocardia cerradoensis]NKY43628.1 enoyl-CoA hydratase/isomerase family protein [Nocardia cerradoensis]OXR40443.1 2,3-dehydroadipyl-CoA hydratase [Nocardia cerradoensis]
MSFVEVERAGSVAIVRLNRPERMNALGTEILAELRDAYARIDSDDDIAVGVMTGTGRAFCAGRDMKEANTGEVDLSEQATTKNIDLYMENNRAKPMISAVNGYAGGAGFYLATRAVDLVLAAESASFQIAEVPRGILHGWQTGYWFNLSHAASMELAYGFRISGRRAYECGLANMVTGDGELMDVAMRWAEHVAAMPRTVLQANRQLRSRLENEVPASVDVDGSRMFREILDSGVAAEGDRSFLEKRTAQFAK